MAIEGIVKHVRRGLGAAAAVLAAGIWFGASAEAGVDTGAAVGIGLGSFALGTALGATPHPYYSPYYYPYGYYYPPPRVLSAARTRILPGRAELLGSLLRALLPVLIGGRFSAPPI